LKPGWSNNKEKPMGTREITYAEAIREAMQEEMRNDPDVFLIGEDVGQGYRGTFGVSTGMYEEFGPQRIIDTPICENSIVGCAVGASLMGMKPIAEIMFEDFVAVCFDQIVNEAAKINFMSGGQFSASIVIRAPGGSAGGTGPHHSQCLESLFMHIPGLLLAIPSNAYDAKGLLKTAIRSPEPVLFFEHKKLYKTKQEIPEGQYDIPFGKGRIVREGSDLTLVAFSYMVKVAEEAAAELAENHGFKVEIVDPRTIVPLDLDLIGSSIEKTSKAVILEEGVLRGGVGSEISARIMEEYFDYLDFPVKRIASRNLPIPMTPLMEEAVLPGKERILREICDLVGL
jgi:pyruvate/2-oxoglutarate/acetoin dehydrogenase E1 component